MSFFNRLFGKGRGGAAEQKSIAAHMEYLNSLRQPAIALSKSGPRRFSKMGGLRGPARAPPLRLSVSHPGQ